MYHNSHSDSSTIDIDEKKCQSNPDQHDNNQCSAVRSSSLGLTAVRERVSVLTPNPNLF